MTRNDSYHQRPITGDRDPSPGSNHYGVNDDQHDHQLAELPLYDVQEITDIEEITL